ncbi:MAG TPA: Ig-like domain-containing protein [Candidatus Manganitrophaceae bacterium]|nr:Ig-like domain-containing protein [Candidatus Manganitrophaceae bacterium]
MGKTVRLDSKTLQFEPNQEMEANATYQVTLLAIRTKKGEEMKQSPLRLVFSTLTPRKQADNADA